MHRIPKAILSVVAVLLLMATSIFTGVANASTGGYTFTFTETGLSSGASWTVTVDSSTYYQSYTRSTSQIVFSNVPSYVQWSVSSPSMTASPSSEGYTIYDSNQNFNINFSPTQYPAEFDNSADQQSQYQWSITVTGTEITGTSFSKTNTQYAATTTFLLPYGNYQWSAANMYEQPSGSVTSGQIEYTASPSTGSFSGTPPSFTDLQYNQYSGQIDFSTSGLPSSYSYTVNLDGHLLTANANEHVDFYVNPGTYSYSYSASTSKYQAQQSNPDNPTGEVTVSAGQEQLITVGYSDYYNAYFNETGLPTGTAWEVNLSSGSVNLGSFIQSSANPPPINLQYGTYAYVIPDASDYIPSPSTGTLDLTATSSIKVIFSHATPTMYNVNFVPSGLSSGQTYWVLINGHNYSGSSTLTVSLASGEYPYTSGSSGYQQIQSAVNVGQSNQQIVLSFTKLTPQYSVQFFIEQATGTVDLSEDTIIFNGNPISTGETIITTGGTFPISAGQITQGQFSSWAHNGQITFGNVNSPSTSVDITSSGEITMYIAPSPPSVITYLVTLTSETGGTIKYTYGSTSGTVTPGSTTTLSLESGTSIDLAATPLQYHKFESWQGTFGGTSTGLLIGLYKNTQETAVFSASGVPVTFHETGLPTGQSWSVVFGGKTNSSTGTDIGFQVQPGTYSYSISGTGGYSAYPETGSLDVISSDTVKVSFIPPGYFALLFKEFGLPTGTQWWVQVDGTQLLGTSSTLQIILPTGTYQYSPSYGGNLEPRNLTSTLQLQSDTTVNVQFYYVFSLTAVNGTESGVTIYYYVNQSAYNSITGYTGMMQGADYLAQYLNNVPGFQLFGAKVTLNGNVPPLSAQKDLLFRSLLWARAVIEKASTLTYDTQASDQINTNFLSKDYVQKTGIALADAVNFLSSAPISDLLSSIYDPATTVELSSMFSLYLEIMTSPSVLQKNDPGQYQGILGVLSDFGLIPQKSPSYNPTTLMSEMSSGALQSNKFGSFLQAIYSTTSTSVQDSTLSSLAQNTLSDMLLHFSIEYLSENAAESEISLVAPDAASVLSGTGGTLAAGDTIASDAMQGASSSTFVAGMLLFVAHLVNQYSMMQANLLQQEINIASNLYYTIYPDLYNSLLQAYSPGSATTLPIANLEKSLESTYLAMLSYSMLSSWYRLNKQLLENQLSSQHGAIQSDQTMYTGLASDAMEIYDFTLTVESNTKKILNFQDPTYPAITNLTSEINITSLDSGFPTSDVLALQFNYTKANESYNVSIGSKYLEVNTYSYRNSTITGDYPYALFFTNTVNRTVLLIYANSSIDVSVDSNYSSQATVYTVSDNTTKASLDFISEPGTVQYFYSSSSQSGNNSVAAYDSSLTFNPSGFGGGTPWGVYINGRFYYATGPLVLKGLRPGNYLVSYVNGSTYYTNAGTESISVGTVPINAEVVFYHYSYITGKVMPDNATVEINGKPVAVINGTFNVTLPGGNYTLTVTENGYLLYQRNLTLNPGSVDILSVKLTPDYSFAYKLEHYGPILAILLSVLVVAAFALRRNKR